MLTEYANQSMTLKQPGTPDEYNEVTYSSSTIYGRKEHSNRLVRNTEGEEVTSSAFVITETEVTVNDLIDDRVVIVSEPAPDLDGDTQFYEVYLA